jgi:hypothetical protein
MAMTTRAICHLGKDTEALVHWACDLYDGQRRDCAQPVLKSCFPDANGAFCEFAQDVMMNHADIQSSGGLLFSFSSDPCLDETLELTASCVFFASGADIPCHLFTKNAEWILSGSEEYKAYAQMPSVREMIAIGFSFSGDECRTPCTSCRGERLAALKRAKEAGIRTYVDLDPTPDLACFEDTAWKAMTWVDYISIGAFPERRCQEEEDEYRRSVRKIVQLCERMQVPVVLKRAASEVVGPMPDARNVVGSDFSLFKR